jgi:glycosyltransferase involved in cell wall biosynthesis
MSPGTDPSRSVSAVIALYNGRNHIIEAIESVLAQTFPVTEIIIVDDGSSDDSVSIIQDYISAKGISESFVNLVLQENSGQGSARNVGANLARSRLIGFLDQDDSWTPTHIETLVEAMHQNPSLGWVYTDFNEIDVHGREIRRSCLATKNYVVPDKSLEALLEKDLMMLPSSSIIRRSAFIKVGGFDSQFRGYEDDDLFVRLFMAGWDFIYIADSLVNYRVHPNNSSSNLSFPLSRMKFYQKYSNLFSSDSGSGCENLQKTLVQRMVAAVIQDIAISARDRDKKWHELSVRFLEDILNDSDFNLKRRVALVASRSMVLVRSAVSVRSWIRKQYRRRPKSG